MKVTNGEVWQAREPLQSLLREPWPVKTAYWLAKLARKINEQVAVMEPVRVGLIRQYGTTDEKGQVSIKPGDPRWDEFVPAFDELMAQQEDLGIDKIILPASDEIRVTPAALLALEPFVEVA